MPRPLASTAAVLAGLLVGPLLSSLRHSRLVREAPLSESGIDAHLRNHSFVHVGGQHRGGTTLLWRLLGTDPAVAAHGGDALPRGLEPEAGALPDGATLEDPHELHGEGIFLQDVYPKSALDHLPGFFARRRLARLACAAWPSLEQRAPEWLRPWIACRATEGIGGYAFAPSPLLSPEHPAVSRQSGRRLFAQWAAHWDLRRPVLLEKSPSNALAAGGLLALWRLAGVNVGAVKFVFITRHPLMQAYAMRAFVDDLSLEQLVAHWLAVETGLRAGCRRGAPPAHLVALTSLEQLTADPAGTVRRLRRWLGVPEADAGPGWAQSPATEAALRAVRAAPNARYAAEHIARLNADGAARREHERIVAVHGDAIATVSGYPACTAPVPGPHAPPAREHAWYEGCYASPPRRDAAWRRAWLGNEHEHSDGGVALELETLDEDAGPGSEHASF
jgi:hypothetical protein